MKKPLLGWPKYYPDNKLHYGKLATVFIVWGLISLLTGFYFDKVVSKKEFKINNQVPQVDIETSLQKNVVGPVNVKKSGEVYEVLLEANVPVQSWAFVEGEVLNRDKEYLYSFGQELWHEQGYDVDGYWSAKKNKYKIKITFPSSGEYFFSVKMQGKQLPRHAFLTVQKKRGSSFLLYWFGWIVLLIGLILNEISNKTFIKFIGAIED